MRTSQRFRSRRRLLGMLGAVAVLLAAGCNGGSSSSSGGASPHPSPQAKKPALPIKVTFEPVKGQEYLKAIYKNESADAFKFQVNRHSTLGEDIQFDLTIGPNETKQDGEPGNHYFSGDLLTIKEADHANLDVKVP